MVEQKYVGEINTDSKISVGYRTKIKNGSKLIIGGYNEFYQVQLTLQQHFNWFQKLMWKWCFGVRVEDYNEE